MDDDSYARTMAENVRLIQRDVIVTHRLRAVEALRDAQRAAPGEAKALLAAGAFHSHADPKMTRHYRQQADQKVRATAAIGKLVALPRERVRNAECQTALARVSNRSAGAG